MFIQVSNGCLKPAGFVSPTSGGTTTFTFRRTMSIIYLLSISYDQPRCKSHIKEVYLCGYWYQSDSF